MKRYAIAVKSQSDDLPKIYITKNGIPVFTKEEASRKAHELRNNGERSVEIIDVKNAMDLDFLKFYEL